MMHSDLSFACFSSGVHSGAFLFAFPEKPLKRGEPTSDYLAFFGFGSGYNFSRGDTIYPSWLEGTAIYPLDITDNVPHDVFKSIRALSEFYFGKGYILDRFEVKRLYAALFSMIGRTPSHGMLDELTEQSLVDPGDTHHSVATTVLIYGVDKTNKFYLQIGLPAVEGADEQFVVRMVGSVNDCAIHNWKYSATVGGFGHANKVIHALNRHAFSKGDSKSVLEDLAKAVGKIYPLMII